MIPFYKPSIDIDMVEEPVGSALKTGQVTNWGNHTKALEADIEKYLGRPAILTACGTHALTFGLLALAHYKLIPKDAKILVPSFTFYASVHSIIWANMTPIFCDIDPNTYTIDIDAATEEYDAIMPVNVFGVHYDIDYIRKKSNKPIIGDNSHGFGGAFSGKRNGTLEHVSCFSSSITKPMQTIEGGILAANTDIVEFVRDFRNWGSPHGQYDCTYVGQWSKITEINAIVGLSSMMHLSSSVARKNEIAEMYKKRLVPHVEVQSVPDNIETTYKDFSVLFESNSIRDKVSAILDENKIGNKKYFYPPVHKMKCFGDMYLSKKLPVTDSISERILCLPIYDSITEKDIDYICTTIVDSL
jgi:dTDP-4-amino-4,6-dideoxygalactose transaminase